MNLQFPPGYIWGYILDGHTPVPVTDRDEWTRWCADHWQGTTRRVGDTTLPDGTRISTVFLGMDHGIDDTRPILFETMVFGGAHDQWQDRYHTWIEAEIGHAAVVARLERGEALDGD